MDSYCKQQHFLEVSDDDTMSETKRSFQKGNVLTLHYTQSNPESIKTLFDIETPICGADLSPSGSRPLSLLRQIQFLTNRVSLINRVQALSSVDALVNFQLQVSRHPVLPRKGNQSQHGTQYLGFPHCSRKMLRQNFNQPTTTFFQILSNIESIPKVN